MLVALFVAGCGSEPPPNILLLVLDTVRDDHTGLDADGGTSRTPTLDGLARRSTVYRHAFANAHRTPPSHASMFTGLLRSGHACTH